MKKDGERARSTLADAAACRMSRGVETPKITPPPSLDWGRCLQGAKDPMQKEPANN